MDVLGFLTGISPWWWVAAALALGTIEVLTFSFFLIWPALAALTVAILMWAFPGLAGSWQIVVFAVLSILYTLIGRQWVMSRQQASSENPELNQRSAALIGRRAVVLDGFADGHTGNVEIDGTRWRAQLSIEQPRPQPGDVLEVTGTNRMTLVVGPVPPDSKE